jgi:hypothetical protein
LNLENFYDCGATVRFISLVNDAFDILNSKQISEFGFKKPLNINNFEHIVSFKKQFVNYVKGLRFLKSNRKIVFLGFLICLESISRV